MLDILADIQGLEFLKPLCQSWLEKLELAGRHGHRQKWKEVADEVLLFYSKSAAAMWEPTYTKKFWKGVKAPKFRITINKAYEYVAVFGPNLIWDIPHRTVKPKRLPEIPPELFQGDEQLQQSVQAQLQQEGMGDTIRAHLLQQWLNYTPREMPGGGLESHNELAVLDALLMGRGALWPQLYSFPGSPRTITGCFHRSPQDLLIDPDAKSVYRAKWIALRHIEPHWEVERRFKLPPGSLKNKSTLETSWHYAELQSKAGSTADRAAGKSNDLVIWYEIWSKMGPGSRHTSIPSLIKDQLEETVGDYAYLAICPDCPYPLNSPTDKLRNGAGEAEVVSDYEWPVAFWKDDRWPVELLDFYADPESSWPVPPLAPALGELKFLNFLIPWLCNRIYSSSRDFWAVLGSKFDEYKAILDEGEDQVVFPMAPGETDDIRTQIMALQQPETRADAWKIVELVMSLFDKRTGLTEFAYGMNEQGTQDRTAETTKARAAAVGVRPEHMQKKVVGWQSRVAAMEGYLAQRFVTGQDVAPHMGGIGAQLWDQYVSSQNDEDLFRQMQFEISAASIRRPNRDKNLADLNELSDRYLPLLQSYGELSGDYSPVNGLLKLFGSLHDMDMTEVMIPAKDPNDPNAQLDQQLKMAEAKKMMAEAMKAESEAQNNPAQLKAAELQMEQSNEQQRLQMELQKMQAELEMKVQEMQAKIELKKQELAMKAQEHALDMQFKQAEGQQDLELQQQKGQTEIAVQREQGAQQVAMGNQQLRHSEAEHQQAMKQSKEAGDQKAAQAKQQTKAKVDSTKATTAAKVDATKKMAAAKPKASK